ncbi:MAG: aspartate aminotransferase family protein [Oligoflexia bacterium]|nr:aspartate aminotransferase family protein [Oligoflexia bacterium]
MLHPTPVLTAEATAKLYSDFVNPQWVRLIQSIGLDKHFVRAQGSELTCDDGSTYLDLLGGYGVYNAGHNHPLIARQLISELQSLSPSMLQSNIPELAAELAGRLCQLAGGRIGKVYFGNSGSEGVETAMKFARAFTRRDSFLAASGAFHGLTIGALSLQSNPWWKDGFGTLLSGTEFVPFGDITSLEYALRTERFAAFIVEPIQGESGVRFPANEYLKSASMLCDKYGSLLVLDEVQTGMYRTGQFLAAQHYQVNPDIVILAKALSGGFVPVSATLMRDDIAKSVYRSPEKAFVHASTFGENSLAMRAGLATLDVIESDGLAKRGAVLGERIRSELKVAIGNSQFVREIRGLGMMNAVEFMAPRSLALKLLFSGFARIHPGLFGQMCVRRLFRNSYMLTQMAGHDFNSLKLLPALNFPEEHIKTVAGGFAELVHAMEHDKTQFWIQGMQIGAKLMASN